MEKVFGVIGGSGFYDFPELQGQEIIALHTPYGRVEGVVKGWVDSETPSFNGGGKGLESMHHEAASKEDQPSRALCPIFFLPRHGQSHHLPPHKINYRANIAALYQCGVTHIVSFNAVGGISENCLPGSIVLPHQVIDYTYGREHTFHDGFSDGLEHLNFEHPCDAALRQALITAFNEASFALVPLAVYACTQGPRLETAAEIKRLAADGCNVVGMTMMPEAALAAEKKIAYAAVSLVVNWAAGVNSEVFSLNNILALLDSSMPKTRETLLKMFRFF